MEKMERLEIELEVIKREIETLQNRAKEIEAEIAKEKEIKITEETKEIEEKIAKKKEIKITEETKEINKRFVNKIRESVEELEGVLLSRDYNRFIESLDEVEFEDAEEDVNIINTAVQKYIVGSMSKVKNEQRKKLYYFIESIGYSKANISIEENVKEYAKYFDKIFFDDNSTKDKYTILDIIIAPYILNYNNDGDADTIILKGECIAAK